MHDVIYHCYLLEAHDSSGMDESETSSDLHLLADENEELLCVSHISVERNCATAYLTCTCWRGNIGSLLGGNVAGHRKLGIAETDFT